MVVKKKRVVKRKDSVKKEAIPRKKTQVGKKEPIKKKDEKFSLKVEYKKVWDYIKEVKNYIYAVLIIFFAFVLIGYFLNDFINLLYGSFIGGSLDDKIMLYIQELILQTEGMSAKELVGFIFMNNFQSSLMGIVFGIYFGIMPLVATVANGYLLGFVAFITVKEAGILVLWRIFPHGIFELPAIFVSLAAGFKIGDYLFRQSKNFFRSVLYLALVSFGSAVVFGLIMLIFNLISKIIGAGATFSYDPTVGSSSAIIFLIFFVILLINMLLGLFVFEREQKIELKRIIINSLRIFLLVVFPLLVIAAIIEGLFIAISI